jgi:hypothetical protein
VLVFLLVILLFLNIFQREHKKCNCCGCICSSQVQEFPKIDEKHLIFEPAYAFNWPSRYLSLKSSINLFLHISPLVKYIAFFYERLLLECYSGLLHVSMRNFCLNVTPGKK